MKRIDLPQDRGAAADMARGLRAMYGAPRQNNAVRMAVAHYLRRMRRVRRGLWLHPLETK
jgi:hypothetical protein